MDSTDQPAPPPDEDASEGVDLTKAAVYGLFPRCQVVISWCCSHNVRHTTQLTSARHMVSIFVRRRSARRSS